MGGLAALTARSHGVAGFVIDEACRDLEELEAVGLPVLSREVIPASGRGRVRIRGVNVPLRFVSVGVLPGDLLVAAESGVVVVPLVNVTDVLDAAGQRVAQDAAEADRLRA